MADFRSVNVTDLEQPLSHGSKTFTQLDAVEIRKTPVKLPKTPKTGSVQNPIMCLCLCKKLKVVDIRMASLKAGLSQAGRSRILQSKGMGRNLPV